MSDELVPDPRQMRASDADRERVAQVLQKAHGEGRIDLGELDERLASVYAAKTYGELVPLTSDLGVLPFGEVSGQQLQQQRSLANRVDPSAMQGPSTSFAFWSGVERKGDWVVPATHTAIAVMGGIEIDLSRARFTQQHTTISASCFWGGIVIYVPEEVTVQVDGTGIMGGFDDKTHRTETIPGGPVVRITGVAIMGGVEVRRPKRPKLKRGDRGELTD